MRTVPRNIPMKFHRSNLKTERQVHESLKSWPKFKFFGQNQTEKSKVKIPLQRPYADSAKEQSYEVSSF